MYNQPAPGRQPTTLQMRTPTGQVSPRPKTEKLPKQGRPKLPKGVGSRPRARWKRILLWSLISGLGLIAAGLTTIAILFWV
jgi:hypothetical protein